MLLKGLATALSPFSETAQLYADCFALPAATVILENENSIDHEGVIPFHKIKDNNCHSTFVGSLFEDSLNALIQKATIENFETDISKVEGLMASKDKSDFHKFKNLDQFVEKTRPNLIDPIDMANLVSNLNHERSPVDENDLNLDLEKLQIYSWQNRLYWTNRGGSHHFAAAQYIAKKMDVPVKVTGRLEIKYFDSNAVTNFNKTFDAFMVPTDHYHEINSMDPDVCKGLVPAKAYNKFTDSISKVAIPFATAELKDDDFRNIYVPENGAKISVVHIIAFSKLHTNPLLLKQLHLRFKSFNSELLHQLNLQRDNKVLTAALKATGTKIKL